MEDNKDLEIRDDENQPDTQAQDASVDAPEQPALVEEVSAEEAAPETSEDTVESQPLEKSEPEKPKKSRKRILQGKVVSNKAQKTIVVRVERQVAHPLYKKYYKTSKKFMAHDEQDACKEGDVVRIKENRPLSKRKRWTLIDIVEHAK